jgi:myosin heavy subunit
VVEALVLVFDLFVQSSKAELEQLVKEHQSKSKVEERSRINRMTTPNKAQSDNLSQSDISDNSREGGMFNSKKKLSRKRGHDGKMKSRHGSRENSEISSREGSVRSSKKAFGPFPHTQQNEHFVHSPKKASPPKVEDSSPKSQTAKPQNLVSIGRKDSNASEISKPKLPLTPTKPVKIESNIERSESARKNPAYTQRSEILPTETPITTRR